MLVATALAFVLACSADSSIAPAARQESAPVNAQTNYSFSISPENGTVRVQFGRVRSNGEESISAFMQRVFDSADAIGARRLIVDLSATRGGDAFLTVPLVKGVIARDRFTKHGSLIVIVGPNTFSAGQNAAKLLQQYARPIFVKHPVS